MSSLVHASRKGPKYKDIIELLLKEGADVNAQTMNGWTPLRTAHSNKDKDLINMLKQVGAYR